MQPVWLDNQNILRSKFMYHGLSTAKEGTISANAKHSGCFFRKDALLFLKMIKLWDDAVKCINDNPSICFIVSTLSVRRYLLLSLISSLLRRL